MTAKGKTTNETMNIVIPLGGLGRRFSDCGYNDPKPLVRVLGKEIIFWLLDSLRLEEEDEIYIAYNESLESHNFAQIVGLKHPSIRMLAVSETRGASETVKICIDHFGLRGRAAILDGDTWYEDDILAIARRSQENIVTYFDSTTPDPIYSYIIKEGDDVAKIAEKKKISDMACSGCYVFSDAERFSHVVRGMNLNKSEETYISQVIAKMIDSGDVFKAAKVDKFHVLGTPEQAIAFSKAHSVGPKRFCFDLDNTLVTAPKVPGDYSSVEPIWETINYLRRLKSMGHTIIVYTARRMRTHGGNLGAVVADIGGVTIDTLSKFNIPYDELHFGKPYAHFYVDDLMVDPRSDMNKKIGFYMEDVTPRHFNRVEKGATFRKTSTNADKLAGEAFYHRWVEERCPADIQAMFPRMISHGEGKLETEIIQGLNFSTLYLNQILKRETLGQLLSCLRRLHENNQDDTLRRTSETLGPKFSERLAMYDHAKYGLAHDVVAEIRFGLDAIAAEGFKKVMIHGDPVFSNVILDNNGDIKLVDMRGREGSELTVHGHELYDFAKVYQSLCGYDEVLLDKKVTLSYRKSMIKFFRSHFDGSTMNKIKTITASLFFSLIPLHDDESKYRRYIKLGLEVIRKED